MDKDGYQLLKDCKEEVKDGVREAIDEYIELNPDCDKGEVERQIDYSGRITEIYDSAVPIYTSDIMLIGSVSDVYSREPECGPAFDGSPTPQNIIAGIIYDILSETAWEELREYLEELENEGKFDEEEDDDEEEEE
jgi:hypothetical protein